MTTLSRVLAELREERDLSQNELARELGISRGYYSLLESAGEREPSLEFLRKLSGVLVGHQLSTPEQFQDACRLGLAALGHDFVDPHAKLIGTVPQEVGIQGDKRLEEVWIISEILGEMLSEDLLRQTIANLVQDNPVHYKYFVPHGRSQWSACLELMRSTLLDRPDGDPSILEDGRLVAIECPPMTCIIPIRILSLSSSERLGAITLGDPTKKRPRFYELETTQVNKIVAELTGVISNLKLRSSWVSEYATYNRLYPQEASSNE